MEISKSVRKVQTIVPTKIAGIIVPVSVVGIMVVSGMVHTSIVGTACPKINFFIVSY